MIVLSLVQPSRRRAVLIARSLALAGASALTDFSELPFSGSIPVLLAQEGPSKPSEDDVKTEVARLVKALDANTLAERDAAEKRILELGMPALGFLPPVDANTPAEMRVRLERIAESLQRQRLEKSIETSLVTLKGDFTVQQALDNITQQTGNQFSTQNLPGTTLTLDLEAVPFWEALDEILDASGLDIPAFSNTPGSLAIRPKAANASLRVERATYAGVFRLEPVEITASRSLRGENQSVLNVLTWISWEPRVEPIFMQFPMSTFSAQADGQNLAASEIEASPEYSPNPKSSQIEVEWQLELPDRSVQKLESVRGKFIAALPSERVGLKFPMGQTGKQSKGAGKLSVTLERVRKNGKIYECLVLVSLKDAGQTMDSYRGWVMANEAYVLDPTGNRVKNVGWNSFKMSGDEIGLSFQFDLAGDVKQYEFVYEAPAMVNEQTFSFKMEDLQLP